MNIRFKPNAFAGAVYCRQLPSIVHSLYITDALICVFSSICTIWLGPLNATETLSIQPALWPSAQLPPHSHAQCAKGLDAKSHPEQDLRSQASSPVHADSIWQTLLEIP